MPVARGGRVGGEGGAFHKRQWVAMRYNRRVPNACLLFDVHSGGTLVGWVGWLP